MSAADPKSPRPPADAGDGYSLSVTERNGYLLATVRGSNSVETIRRYSREIREACLRLHRTRALVVVDLRGPRLEMLDVYKAVAAGSDESAGLGVRVAYVDLNPQGGRENMQIAEDVAATRGIAVRTFTDIGAAETWLLGGEETN